MASKARILIVEDESIVALDLQNRVRNLEYAVVARASSGQEAIDHALAFVPDLILMDIRLQGPIDGVEAAATIRRHLEVPIIYLTAYSDNETLSRAKITEPYGYLIKPFEERELHTAIEMALYKHNAEAQIRRQAYQLQQIVQAIPEGILLIDGNYSPVSKNPLADEYLANLATWSDDGKLAAFGELPMDTLLDGSENWHEIALTEPTEQVFEFMVRSLSDSADNDLWMIFIRDVTQQRAIQKRANQNTNLASVGQLAAGIAHDFNNILSILTLGDQMVLITQKDLLASNRERLDHNIRQIERGSQLIRQILDFSRHSTLEQQPLDLVPLAKEVVKLLERTLPEHLQFETDFEISPCVMKGDPTKIQQVLMNLVLNAHDAMPKGGGLRIAIKSMRYDKQDELPLPEMIAGLWVKLQIEDSGIGIAPDAFPHIFDPFFTTKADNQGTGLGLSQVYGIVRQHNGYIDVRSQQDIGTVFTIYFPLLDQHSTSPADDDLHIHLDDHEQHEAIILLVEDESDLRKNMCSLLEIMNYQVYSAADGQKALQIYEQPDVHIDLVVSDLVMPNMDGAALCRALLERDPELKIIITTGYSTQQKADELEMLGITHVFQKPIEIKKLIDVIEQLVSDPIYST